MVELYKVYPMIIEVSVLGGSLNPRAGVIQGASRRPSRSHERIYASGYCISFKSLTRIAFLPVA